MTLTSKQRAFLNSQAHSLKPIIQIGKNGLNDQIKTSVRQALDARELIKVTLLQNTDENIHEVAEILEEEIGVDTVQKIGRILILYKQSSKKENRKISVKVKEIQETQESRYMAIELLTPFTKVELEPEIKDKKRKQVGILGGNFNPVHNAHLVVADQVRQQLGLDKVLLMPEYEPPHVDKKETIDEGHRLKMLELAIEGIEGLEIETIELERKGISYTYDTMKLLNERDPDTDYYFIIGADMVDYLPKWYRIDELVEMVQFVGVQRPRYKAGTSYPVIWVDVPLMDISSSMVREFIAQGRTPNFMLPKPVLDYIKKEGLYQ